MTLRVYIPFDAAALAVGAGQVASAISAAAARQNVALDIVRTGSRGLYWLEPMVEVETPNGRVAYGPVAPHDAEGLLAALRADGAYKLRLGPTEDIPWLKRQTRLTFARCGIVDPRSLDDYRAHAAKVSNGRSRSAPRQLSRRFCNRACAAAAAPDFRPASSGARWRRPKPNRNTLCATPTRATAALSPTV
jgi:hypothetical protein